MVVLFIGCGVADRLPSVLEGRCRITDGAGTGELGMRELIDALVDADVIFVGEVHDDSLTHVFEHEVLRRVHERYERTAVSLEMFERDVQEAVDLYLSGRISEEDFLSRSRPWGNYASAYRPLVAFAQEHRLPVLAMNVPRRYASRVARMGEEGIAALPDSEKAWVASELKGLDDAYKKRFMELMGSSRPGPMARMSPDNLYLAQCLKDDTMVETIFRFRLENPRTKIVSFQGDFHSAFGLGVVQKLKLLDSTARTAVVSVIPVEDVSSLSPEHYAGQGDYLVFVQRLGEK